MEVLDLSTATLFRVFLFSLKLVIRREILFLSLVLPALHYCYCLLLSILFGFLLDSVLDGGYSTWNGRMRTRLEDGVDSRRTLRSFYLRTGERFVRSLTEI